MNLKNKIIIFLIAIGASFFIGRFSVKEKIRIETKTIKVTDTEAIARAVALERKKLLTQFKQKKEIDTVKLPDGTIKTHETIASEQTSTETLEASNRYNLNLDTKTREESNSTLKTPANDFAVELLIGKKKFDFFNSLPQESLYFGANLSYRIFGGTWIGVWGLYKNQNEQIYGVSARQEF